MVSGVLSGALSPALDGGACPHLAVLLRSEEEFAPVVASFYALGAARGGWLVHRAVEPAGDRVALASRASMWTPRGGAPARNRADRLDEPPEYLPRRLDLAFDEALGRGLERALVLAHAGGAGLGVVRARDEGRARLGGALPRPPDRHALSIRGGRLDAPAALGRLTGLGAHHDGVLVPSMPGWVFRAD